MTIDSEEKFKAASLALVRCLYEGDGDGAATAFADILLIKNIAVSDAALLRLTAAAHGARSRASKP